MNMNRFTEKAQAALVEAQQRAQDAGNPQIEGLHLPAALPAQPDGMASAILPPANANPDNLRRRVDQDIATLSRVSGAASPPHPSAEFSAAIQRAQRAASQMGDEYVSVERLLLALADLKVQGRRLPLQEVALERRLQRALRAAFLQPRVYTPRVPTQEQEMLRPAPAGVGREGGGLSELSPTFPSTQLGTGGPAEDSWEDTVRARRRRPRHGRGEA